MYKRHKVAIALFLLCCFLVIFFCGLFYYDNKYNTPPPYGQAGVISINESDFERSIPIYLIDGWLLTDSTATKQQTYIGEFSNLQRGNLDKSPHGKAVYELTLRYSGEPRIVAIDFPELFSKYKISINGKTVGVGRGSAHILFPLWNGDNLLSVETRSQAGYYSGIYYPPALGDETTMLGIERVKTLLYSVGVFCTIILIGFTIQFWRRQEGDRTARWMAWLCFSFSCYVSYYFVHIFSMPFAPFWYFVEDLSLYGIIYCMIQLTRAVTGLRDDKTARIASVTAVVLPLIMTMLQVAVPYWKRAVWLHGQLKNIYFILTFLWLLGASILCIRRQLSEYPYIVAGNLIFGAGLVLNLFQSNLFEPIYSMWQFEWCGLLLVWLFASMMIARNRRVLKENKQLTTHLESLVEKRTEELSCVLEERRAFFSDMAHDLKSPLFATKTFIEAIRIHSVGVDDELAYYLDQLDSKQTEMSKRVQSLNTLNSIDKIQGKKEQLSIISILEEVYAAHNAEAEVSAIHLVIRPPEKDCFVFMQQEKLLIVFENLIFNALHATPPNGTINITAKDLDDRVEINVDDNGCGISEAEQPFIFKRFYIGEQNRASGSGLGLYIVKTVLEEAGGSVSVTSQVGRGSRFTLVIPRCQ